MQELHDLQLEPLIQRALEEDWGNGDWATDLCVSKGTQAQAFISARSPTLLSGLEVAKAVFRNVDPKLQITLLKSNGQFVEEGETFIEIQGEARSIIKAERVALNFLSRMCGITYMTHTFVNALENYKTQILYTRKTTPGLRILENAATSVGGARKPRLCLTDGALVNGHHILAAGSITKAVNSLVESLAPTIKVEVEVCNLDDLQEAIDAGADLVILKNMSLSEMALAVRTARGRVLLEACGNIRLEELPDLAATGVDFVSSEAIVHAASWADLNLHIKIH